MKKVTVTIAAITLISIIASPDKGLCRDKGSLYNMFRSRAIVKVSVSDIANSTGEDKVDVADLKEKLEDVFAARKSIHFEVLEGEEGADIIIGCDVTKYYWSENDPIDMIISTGAIVMDAIMSENYAYLEAVFTVRDAKKDRLLWKKKLKIDLTRKDMSEQESITMINAKTAKIFMRDCFSKGRSKPGR